MSLGLTANSIGFRRWQTWRQDIVIAVLVAALLFAAHAVHGMAKLADPGADPDSVMRMVQVLDWLSGQNWFDMHQYRMGPPGGFLMHWSRLVDVPIAAIILAGKALTGSLAAGEAAASVLWPYLLLSACLFLLIRLARRLWGEDALLPVIVIGAAATFYLVAFRPATLDHHNVQIDLTLATLLFLFGAPGNWRWAAGAGLTSALSLVVGMETAPYVAVAAAVVVVDFVLAGPRSRYSAAAFGAAFALASLASFLATVPVSLWGAPECDSFTIPQASLALLGGGGLVLCAVLPFAGRTLPRRFVAAAVVGALAAALLVAVFPQCLASPYAGLDPRLKTYWLDLVVEAQPFTSMLRKAPADAGFFYGPPLLAMIVIGYRLATRRPRREDVVLAAFLTMSVLVSLWEVRGGKFAILFSAVELAGWVAGLRARIGNDGTLPSALKTLASWLVCLNLTWSLVGSAAASALDVHDATSPRSARETCFSGAVYDRLARMPRGTVLSNTDLGPMILRHTPDRVLSGPYHRNQRGNLAMLDAFMGSDAKAKSVIDKNGVTIVAICPGNSETPMLAADAPHGFLAHIVAGAAPAWLAPVPGTRKSALWLYTVRPN